MVHQKFCRTIHLPSWPTVVGAARSGPIAYDRHNAVTHGGRDIPPWATAAGPSTVSHGGSRPATAVPHGARICCLYNTEIQLKMSQ
jgi:hypothetical protein